jgi:RecB family endonuclease NucS
MAHIIASVTAATSWLKSSEQESLKPAPFADEVHDMGDFVKQHPEILGEDVVIVSRELEHGPDGRRLDFLVYDTEFNQPGIVELKRDNADEKILLQTLRYADWLRNNPDTIRYQISRQKLNINAEEVDIEKIKIFIVAT